MSDAIVLTAQAREEKGRGGARSTRKSGWAPAIVYGAEKPSELVSIEQNLLNRLVHQVGFHTQVLELKMPSGKTEQVIVKEIQYHPVKPMVRHVDFCRVSKKKAMRLAIPIQCEGEDACLAISEQGGVLIQHKHEIEVECLPADLPNHLTVNVAQLVMDQTLHVSDIPLPKGVVFVDPPHDDHDHPVVSVHTPKLMEEEPSQEAAASEEQGADEGEIEAVAAEESASDAAEKSEE